MKIFIFVRQVVEGPADRSYGIQVARLAGLPSSVIERAKTILDHLESDRAVRDEVKATGKQVRGKRKRRKGLPESRAPKMDQLELL